MLSTLCSPASAEMVRLPIKLDYPLMRQLMLNQLFNTADGSAEVLRDPAACSKIFLSDPQLQEQQKKLEIRTHLKADIGTALFGACTSLFRWEGNARFLTEPVILPGARSVRLNILSTELIDPRGEPLSSGQLWDLANGELQSLVGRYEVDLSPSIDELNKLLPTVLDRRSADQLRKITDSLNLAAINVAADGIEVEVGLQVDKVPPDSRAEAPLSAAEMQQLETKWRMMDAMITFAVKHYAAATQLQEAREALQEILLDARYQLRDALASPVSRTEDPVRHWFIESWQRLGPELRRISLEIPDQESMLLLSLLTATDLLEALDKLGPSFGLDISVDGLRRLGRLLIDQPGIDPLQYDEAVDPQLRKLFNLPPSPEPPEPSGFNIDLWPIGNAWAGGLDERLKLWVPKKQELPEYLPLIRDLLLKSVKIVAKQEHLPGTHDKLYRHLVLTTAWQESCWRQFVIEKGKVVPLRSGTGDVGLMQVNERVWRGFYDIQKLRWDTAYNVDAGAEILLQYLVNYALKKGEHKHSGGVDNLARASYSAYNSGPGSITRYRNPKAGSRAKKIDKAFWSKYQLVKQGKELEVAECLGGDAAKLTTTNKLATNRSAVTKPKPQVAVSPRNQPKQVAAANTSKTPRQIATAPKSLGKSWVLAQPKQHFTLQLAVFGSLSAAQKFRTDNPLPDGVAIAPLSKDKAGQFVVLSGSYSTRTAADQAKARYRRLKPWVRPFQDVQTALK